MQPLISIIIPSYNPGNLIRETLDSVYNQVYPEWECLIIDDGSKDESPMIIDEFLEKDNRFFYRNRSGKYKNGGSGARNEGLEYAMGEYVIFLDADDILSKDCLQRRTCRIKEGSDMIIFPTGTFKNSLGDSHKIWNSLEDKGLDHHSLIRSFLNQDMPWHTNGVLWKRSFLESIGGWDEDLKVWQDWELHIRALLTYPVLGLFNEIPDNYYRTQVEGSIASGVNTKEYIAETCSAISRVLRWMNKRKKLFKPEIRALIIRNLILKPIALKFYRLPLNLYFRGCCNGINRGNFVFCYLQRLLMTSYRFRRLTGWNLDSKMIKKYDFRNTHLKLNLQDISNKEIHIGK